MTDDALVDALATMSLGAQAVGLVFHEDMMKHKVRPKAVKEADADVEEGGVVVATPPPVHDAAAVADPPIAGENRDEEGDGAEEEEKEEKEQDEESDGDDDEWDEDHPEAPERISAIWAALGALDEELAEEEGRLPTVRLPCPSADDDLLLLVHPPEYVASIDNEGGDVPRRDYLKDVYTNEHSASCARLACGGAVSAVSAVARGDCVSAVAVVRPPGHHAEPSCGMGFCLFANVAVAVQHVRKTLAVPRVMIVDWDVHHGNGTQETFKDDPNVLLVSIHRWDQGRFYPNSGAPSEVGTGEAKGRTVNVAWNRRNLGDLEYVEAFERVVMPLGRAFAPDLVVVSAGFDAAIGDPLGGMAVSPDGYAYMTDQLKTLAGGKMAIVLEGGYNLESISRSMAACVGVLRGRKPEPIEVLEGVVLNRNARESIDATIRHIQPFWPGVFPDAPAAKVDSPKHKTFLPPWKRPGKAKGKAKGKGKTGKAKGKARPEETS